MLTKVYPVLQSRIVLPPFETVRQIFTPFVFFSVMHLRNDMCWQDGQKGWERKGRGGTIFLFSDKERKVEKSEDKLAGAGYHIASVGKSVKAIIISFCLFWVHIELSVRCARCVL